MGTQVAKPATFPSGCTSVGDPCWNTAVNNGQVKFVATTATGGDGRAVKFAFIAPPSGQALRPVTVFYADGSLVSPSNSSLGTFASSNYDWVKGNASGLLMHDASSNTCTQMSWNGQAWTNAVGTVSCN